MNDGNYLQDMITAAFNIIVGNCTVNDGTRPLPFKLFQDIISMQYDSINKVVLIETSTHNYTLVEKGSEIKLSEFTRGLNLERMKY